MSFYRYFKLVAVATALMVGVSTAAKNSSGVIRYVAGGPDAQHQKKGKGDWKNAKYKEKVFQNDNFRTGDEAQIIIALADGSSLTINERTEVSMTELMNEDGINRTMVNIKNGKVNFEVQKQANGGSFKFKTGTSTAAIRGTRGFFGMSSKRKPIASLSKGSLDFQDESSNKKVSIKEGQTAISIGNEIVVLDLSTSGEAQLFDQIDSVLNDTTLSIDSLKNAIKAKDQQLNAKLAQLRESMSCTFSTLPDTIYTSNQTIKASCPAGTMIGIFDTPVRSNGQPIELNVNWAPSLIGPKVIPFTCYIDSTTYFPCGQLATYYAGNLIKKMNRASIPLTITSSSPLEICNSANVTVEGSFDSTNTDATLFVTLGKYTSPNLVPLSAGGHFSHTIPISDKLGNWNEQNVIVEYTSEENGTEKVSIPLSVNKTCSAINMLPPNISVNVRQCKADVSINQTKGDNAIYSFYIDNNLKKEHYVDEKGKFSETLSQGAHQYKFLVTDQAGNKKEITKNIECFRKINPWKIVLKGGNEERLRVPPPPDKFSQTIYKRLSFTIKGLPNNDPFFIKQIVISQSGKKDIILRTSDLQSNTIEQEIELTRGKENKVDIVVTLKSQQVLKATKKYGGH